LFLFPLTAGQQHGALAAAGRRRHELSPQQVDFLTTLANQAAMVLDNARLYEEVRESYFSTITALARSIDARDEYTHGHSERVTRYALMSARQLGFTEEQLEELHVGAILHDVGKIGIPDDILNKPGRLSEEEFEIMKQHPTIGAKILEEAFSRRPNVIRLVKHHHERYDGRGYPDGLRGEEVSMSVLVLAVADSYDAMTSDRCYRRAFSQEAALHELRMGKLKHYHPDAVEALVAALEEEAGVLPFQRPSQREPVLVRRDRPAVAA
jgi:putative nucleotidyltransferase with HDIG domain